MIRESRPGPSYQTFPHSRARYTSAHTHGRAIEIEVYTNRVVHRRLLARGWQSRAGLPPVSRRCTQRLLIGTRHLASSPASVSPSSHEPTPSPFSLLPSHPPAPAPGEHSVMAPRLTNLLMAASLALITEASVTASIYFDNACSGSATSVVDMSNPCQSVFSFAYLTISTTGSTAGSSFTSLGYSSTSTTCATTATTYTGTVNTCLPGASFQSGINGLYIIVAGTNAALLTPTPTPTSTPSGTFRPGFIKTVAGSGTQGYNGDGINALTANMIYPYGMSLATNGDFYIADQNNNRIRFVSATTGLMTTVAGTGVDGFSGDGGYATSAKLSYTPGVTVDSSGNLFVIDFNNNRVRFVNGSTGIISTLAGNGVAGFSGDNNAATSAQLDGMWATAVDPLGNVYIADQYNNRVRLVTKSSRVITTYCGTGTGGFNGDNIAATSAQINSPWGVALSPRGLYIVERNGHRLRFIAFASGLITTLAGTGVAGYNGDSISATSAQINGPGSVAWSPNGDVYIVDRSNFRLRVISNATGIITTLAGTGAEGFNADGILATTALLDYPSGMALASTGAVYFVDQYNTRVRVVAPLIQSPMSTFTATSTSTSSTTTSVTSTGSTTGTTTGTLSTTISGTSTGSTTGTTTGTSSTTYSPTTSWRPLTRTSTAVGTFSVTPTPATFTTPPDSFVRYVRVTQTIPGVGINFAEFKLFNSLGANVALYKNSSQISTYFLSPEYDFSPAHCNDGNTASFCHTLGSSSDWWEVDLGSSISSSSLTYFDLWARSASDCCSDRSTFLAVSFMDVTRRLILNVTTTAYGFPYTQNLVPLIAALTPASPSTVSTASPTPACAPALYRALPRTDLVGILMGNAWYPGATLPASSEAACRQACCDAPVCDAYTFSSNDLSFALQQGLIASASCFLYTNVTALVPNGAFTSGALLSTYS